MERIAISLLCAVSGRIALGLAVRHSPPGAGAKRA